MFSQILTNCFKGYLLLRDYSCAGLELKLVLLPLYRSSNFFVNMILRRKIFIDYEGFGLQKKNPSRTICSCFYLWEHKGIVISSCYLIAKAHLKFIVLYVDTFHSSGPRGRSLVKGILLLSPTSPPPNK